METKSKVKRLIAVLLTMILVLALMPISAFAADGVAINETNFPDAIFRQYVSDNFDTDANGVLSDAEVAKVWKIDVSNKGINSLKGLEYFTFLSYLNCCWNNLTSLDVSKNTELTYFACRDNQLTSLDVTKNTKLETLNCWSNKLTELDVTKNTALKELYCTSNQLTSLDVSNNTKIYWLNCTDNQLTTLDVSNNTKLSHFDCSSNALTSIDISKNVALADFNCSVNKIKDLDVKNNTSLWSLRCSSNQLTELDVRNNINLTYLSCGGNKLTSLDVRNNTALKDLHCSSNKLTSLDVSNNKALTTLQCGWNQIASLDVGHNTELNFFACSNNKLTSLDVSKNTKMHHLECSSNPLTVLDVSKNTALTYLSCCNNSKLTSLDLSNNTALEELWCWNTGITSLDLSNNIFLTKLDCFNNGLTITPNEDGTFNLNNLPGNFNVYRASNWQNSKIVGSILTLDKTTTQTTYEYDLGNGMSATFYLKYAFHTHDYSNKWSYDETSHWHGCDCGDEIDKEKHNLKDVGNAKEATEKEEGYTGDKKCACGYEEKGSVIPKLPHTHKYGEWTSVEGDAENHWKECVCGDKISEAHDDGEIINAKDATTTEEGYTGDKVCTECRCVLEKGKTIPKIHTHIYSAWTKVEGDAENHWKECACGDKISEAHGEGEIVNAKDATTTEEGYTGDKVCTECGHVLEKGEIIDKIHTHSYSNDLSFDETNHWKECSCGDQREVAEHDFVIENAKEPTATEFGYTGDSVCTGCGYTIEGIYFEGSDDDIVQSHPHSYDENWSSDETGHWNECECGEKGNQGDHDFVTEGAKEPTDTEMGYTGDKVCSVCGYTEEGTYYEKTDDDKPGTHEHNFVDTWISDGTNHWKKCDSCDEKAESVGHTVGVVNAKDPTKTEPGYSGDKACTVCGHVVEEGTEVHATGNNVDISKIVDFIKKTIDEIDTEAIGDALDKIKGILDNIDTEAIGDVLDKIKGLLGNIEIDSDAIADFIDKIKGILGNIDTEAIGDVLDKIKGLLGNIEIDSDAIADFIDKIKDAIGDTKAPTGNGAGDDTPSSDKDNNTNVDADANANAGANTNNGSANGAGDGSAESSGKLPNTGATAGLAAFAAFSAAAAVAFVTKKKKD